MPAGSPWYTLHEGDATGVVVDVVVATVVGATVVGAASATVAPARENDSVAATGRTTRAMPAARTARSAGRSRSG